MLLLKRSLKKIRGWESNGAMQAVCAYYNAFRCKSMPARQGVRYLVKIVPDIIGYIHEMVNNQPEEYDRILHRAAVGADSLRAGSRPEWICSHGLSGPNGVPEIEPEESWDAIYSEQRNTMLTRNTSFEIRKQVAGQDKKEAEFQKKHDEWKKKKFGSKK